MKILNFLSVINLLTLYNVIYNFIFFFFFFPTHYHHWYMSKRYHNSTIVDYTRGGINLENEKTSDGTTSRLLLTRANFRDAGNYTCVASQTLPTITSGTMSSSPSTSTPSTFSQLTIQTVLPDSITIHVIWISH